MFNKPQPKAAPQRPAPLTAGQAESAAYATGLGIPAVTEAAPVRKPRGASVIASDITIDGGVSGEGEVQIDGVVRGDVRVAKLIVGETGNIEGNVFAEAVEVKGRVVGGVIAKSVRLYATSHVDGDVTHEQLAMETGAFFQGRSLKFQRPAVQMQPQSTPHLTEATGSHAG